MTPFFNGEMSMFRCLDCDFYYAAPIDKQSAAGLNRYFKEFYNSKDRIYDPRVTVGQIWRPTPIRDSLRAMYRAVHPKLDFGVGRAGEAMTMLRAQKARSLLDAGCSYGAFVRLARQCGIEAYGVEPNEEVVDVLRQCGVDAIVGGSFPDERGPLPRYDALTFFHVLMYIPDLSPIFFRRCREVLNSGGVLVNFCSDPRHRGQPEIDAGMRTMLVVNYTSEAFMRRVANDAGFSTYEYRACIGEPLSCFHILTA
ncbi:MAG TPA: class I SAM-dependent methyltransferase [Stellaceae bacterium]|nr:class I SAM-dependent methyltransferase [Stellaceae bacterium]